MATWSEFAALEPEMAERGLQQLSIPVAYLATATATARIFTSNGHAE